MQVQQRRYSILSSVQAAIGGVTAIVVGVLYRIDPSSLRDPSLTTSMAILGGITLVYYLTVHQFLRKSYYVLSAVILSLLSVANILLVIVSTGGFDSAYYSLWLLAIVVAGFFGSTAMLIAVTATLAFYGYDLWNHNFDSNYFFGHLGQIIISLATAIVAEWIHTATGRTASQQSQVSELSGELGQEQLKSEVIMNSIGEGVMVVNTNRQVQLLNPAAVEMTGWDQASALGIDYRLVLSLKGPDGNKLEDNGDPFLASWQQGKSVLRDNLTMETKGGHKLEISFSVSPMFNDQKQITGGIGLFRDISAEKAIARQKDEFISTASHEMRTPVAAIEGYLALSMNPAVATIDERAKGYLDKAHASTQHLGELFRDLLSVTKLEDNPGVDKSEVFDLTEMVKDAVADMQFAAQKKGLEIYFGAGDTTVRREKSVLPLYVVRANPQRIREVTMNLMENAIKFTSQGSVRVTITGTDDTVTVGVNDTGIGISAEDIPHLFQKFYRIDNSSTRTIGGTGLGLYLCRTIIELFGGRIWVESKLGEGSTFRFSLPRLRNEELAKADAKSSVSMASPTPAAQGAK